MDRRISTFSLTKTKTFLGRHRAAALRRMRPMAEAAPFAFLLAVSSSSQMDRFCSTIMPRRGATQFSLRWVVP